MIGHSVLKMPKAVHRAKPTTVNAYMRAEIAAVSPVLITFQTCGTKLVTEQIEAPYPTSKVVSNCRRPLFPVKGMSVRYVTWAIWHRGLNPAPNCYKRLQPLYLRRAYDDLIFRKVIFQSFPELRPPGTVERFRHNFGNDNPVPLEVAVIDPQSLCRTIRMKGHSAKTISQLGAYDIEPFARKGCRQRKQYLDKVRHFQTPRLLVV
jgi:hypothetical protein